MRRADNGERGLNYVFIHQEYNFCAVKKCRKLLCEPNI